MAWHSPQQKTHPVCQVFVDLHPGVGSFFDGWLQMRAKADLAMYYMAFPECEVTVEWLKVAKTAKISGLFLSEVLPIQGFTTKIDENPNLSEKPPAPPRLNVLKVADGSLSLPEGIAEQWASHPRWGQEFEKWLESFHTEFSTGKVEGASITTPVKKRPGPP